MEELTDRWSEINAVFEAALDLPDDKRPAFLERVCRGDDRLRAAVDRLLTESGDTEPLLEPGGALSGVLGEEEMADLLAGNRGQRVGAYRIVREIGCGGMAEVYLAERADDVFDQQVALKLIQPNRATAKVIRRFEQERQIVASLNHPHIARCLDGGITEDGRPYFVMEYVDGQPVDRYCDQHRMTVEERLELYLVVVQTVRYAHRNLLIHRDLKPANIFVTADGHVKLLDFGIAKMVNEDVQATRTGAWITPEYACPEQLNDEPATTASDQYQLGLLLFELLTGRRPFDHVPRNLVEVVQAICQEEPPAPSTVVLDPPRARSQIAEMPLVTAESLAAARRTTPQRLQKALRGDLDAVILKALAKKPELRYDSTEQLIAEVERYLADLPVQVRAGSVRYRAFKFVSRHRLLVGVALAFAVLITGYAATATVQSRQIARQRDQAEAAAVQAEQVKGFLVDIFERADPYESPADAGKVTARDLLDRGAQRIERELAGQPSVQAELMHVIGKTYGRLGHFDRGRELLEAALEIRRQLLGEDHLEVAQNLNDLATIFRDSGDYAAAERLNRRALATRRRLLGEKHAKVTGSRHNLARVLEIQGKYQEAEALLRQALAVDREIFGGDFHRDVSYDLHSLGELLAKRGRVEEAEALFLRALQVRRQLLGDMDPAVANSLRQLALIELDRGEIEAAERLVAEALDIHRRVLGGEHRAVATDLVVLGRVRFAAGDLDRAEALFRQALEVYRGFLGTEHRLPALAAVALGETHQARGDHHQAVELFRQALTTLTRRLPVLHPEVADVLATLGRSLGALGRTDEAAERLSAALEIRRSLYEVDDPRIIEIERDLSDLWISQSGLQCAHHPRPHLWQALQI